jgi:hypothetical protein
MGGIVGSGVEGMGIGVGVGAGVEGVGGGVGVGGSHPSSAGSQRPSVPVSSPNADSSVSDT